MNGDALQDEISRWLESGKSPHVWWRDDDAIAVTPALERLAAVAGAHDAHVLLAVIPAHAQSELASYVAQHQHLSACVHGWSHTNLEPVTEKKCELGLHRSLEDVVADVRRGSARLDELFDGQLVPVLVPPWNRMREDLIPHLEAAGLRSLSMFGHKLLREHGQVNTHVDVMDWKAPQGARGKSVETVRSELADALGVARQSEGGPVGILTHHLVHDEAAWDAIASVVAEPGLKWTPFPMPARQVR